jgi:hypothetical protein
MKKLIQIQSELKAPKNQFNSFGKYKYRSAEDILEALKPLLAKYECLLTVSDEMVEVGGRVYVKATATISDGSTSMTTSAFAREEETKKGMDASQITGSASSYARKYSLAGLLLIEDTKDSDYTNTHEPTYVKSEDVEPLVQSCKSVDELAKLWKQVSPDDREKYQMLFTEKKQSCTTK